MPPDTQLAEPSLAHHGAGGLLWATAARGLVTVASDDESILDAARDALGRHGYVACLLHADHLTLAGLLLTRPDLVVLDASTAAQLWRPTEPRVDVRGDRFAIVVCVPGGPDHETWSVLTGVSIDDLGVVAERLLGGPSFSP